MADDRIHVSGTPREDYRGAGRDTGTSTLATLKRTFTGALALGLTGPVVTAVAGPLGISSAAVSAWNIVKWPVLVIFVVIIFATLYHASPNVRLREFRSVLPGALFALVLWLLASVALAVYVANFGSYDKTYGTLAGVVVFLLWLWISNVALLLGATLTTRNANGRSS